MIWPAASVTARGVFSMVKTLSYSSATALDSASIAAAAATGAAFAAVISS